MATHEVKTTIEKAAKKIGSQRALARLLGEQDSTISAFKKGRPISYQKHAQIAATAGLDDLALRILIEGMAETLSDDLAHEAQAKAGLKAMLAAFPQTSSGRLCKALKIRAKDRWKQRAIGPFFSPGHRAIDRLRGGIPHVGQERPGVPPRRIHAHDLV